MSVDSKFAAADRILVDGAVTWLKGFRVQFRQPLAAELPKWFGYTALEHAGLVGRVLDHFESDPEPQAGKDFLPVDDGRAQEILDAFNAFASYGLFLPGGHLHHAIEWAKNGEEVACVYGPGPDGTEVHLTDGTVIVWSPDRGRWEFAAGTGGAAVVPEPLGSRLDEMLAHPETFVARTRPVRDGGA